MIPTEREGGDAQPFEAVAEALGLGMPFRIHAAADGVSRRFVHVGSSCLALNGVTAQAAMADPSVLYDLILPEHQMRFAEAEAAAIAEQRGFAIEVQMRRADGELRWHRIASSPRRLPDGSTLWDGLQTDITETKRLADELADQRRRLQMAVDATGLGLWEWDPRGPQVLWSDKNKALFGLGPDTELDIFRYMDLIHPDDLPAIQEIYRSTAHVDEGGDFRVEHRTKPAEGAEPRWILTHGRVIKEEGEARMVVGTSVDITERKAAEDRRSLLLGELAHRAKNGLTVMMAIVDQTARSVDNVEAFRAALMARLQAMSASQDLVTETGGGPVKVGGVLRQVLSPFGIGRFEIDPAFDAATVAGQMATSLGLVLHEMATNAVKYGALSARKGVVRIDGGEDGGRVRLHWREAGGPAVTAPAKQGFGSRVLQTALAPHGGKVKVQYRADGFEADAEFPAAG